MSVTKLYVDNFKGIGSATWIDVKPITLFIGANSSGKSSCIHALACLSQTMKVPNNSTPIVLDDEYANVHLGRFIEVLHSKSYKDKISLGVRIDNVRMPVPPKKKNGKPTIAKVEVEAIYEFKCSQRTQDVRVENANIRMGTIEYNYKWTSSGYTVTEKNTGATMKGCQLGDGFFIKSESLFGGGFDEITPFLNILNIQSAISAELLNTFYLGPFRESPRRKYETRGANPTEVGSRGESAITMLANESFQRRKDLILKKYQVG